MPTILSRRLELQIELKSHVSDTKTFTIKLKSSQLVGCLFAVVEIAQQVHALTVYINHERGA